ncbi:MAG: enoyl-CoA hydratase/isomerase family protein [Dehalococcoidia bacterium]
MSDSLVVVTSEGGVGRLRLNRAEKRNAINSEVSRQILSGMAELDADDSVMVIVVEGTDGAFCAGADMTESLAAYESGDTRFNPAQVACDRVTASPKPTVAAVDGPAYGAGAILACACDIRLMSDRARFRLPGADYGLVVGAVSLPQIVGGAVAKELIFTSRVVDAEEALRIGLANRVVPQADFAAAVEELTAPMVNASPLALQWSKRVVNAAVTGADAKRVEQQADMLLRGGPDSMTRFARATQRVTGQGGRGS